ncbi:MAG: PP2C family protein-serine/threonine phosphatase [Bacteroidia bacterium]
MNYRIGFWLVGILAGIVSLSVQNPIFQKGARLLAFLGISLGFQQLITLLRVPIKRVLFLCGSLSTVLIFYPWLESALLTEELPPALLRIFELLAYLLYAFSWPLFLRLWNYPPTPTKNALQYVLYLPIIFLGMSDLYPSYKVAWDIIGSLLSLMILGFLAVQVQWESLLAQNEKNTALLISTLILLAGISGMWNGFSLMIPLALGGLLATTLFLYYILYRSMPTAAPLPLLSAYLHQLQSLRDTEETLKVFLNEYLPQILNFRYAYLELQGPNESYTLSYPDSQLPASVRGIVEKLSKLRTEDKVLYVDNLQTFWSGAPSQAGVAFQISLVYPPAQRHRLKGILVAPPEITYEAPQIEIMEVFLTQTTLMIESAQRWRYHGEALATYREMDYLRQTREALLPIRKPIFPDVEYAVHIQEHEQIGGDYYHIYERDPKNIEFVLADTSGSGVAAGYQMAQLRGVLISLWQQKVPTTSFLPLVNQALLELFHKNQFVAITYLHIDPTKKAFTVWRAGNPPILHYRAQEKKMESLRPPGSVIGNLSTALLEKILQPQTCGYAKGDVLVLTTDGITETKNPQEEEFGIENLQKTVEKYADLAPPTLIDKILQEVQAFTQGPIHDDATLIVVRFK